MNVNVAPDVPASGADVSQGAAPSDERRWLERQCRAVGARAGLVVLRGEGGSLDPVAAWPGPASVEPLIGVAERAAADDSGLFAPLPDRLWAVGLPIRDAAGVQRAVVALAVAAGDEEALSPVLRQIEWGAAGLTLLIERRDAAAGRARLARLSEGVATLAATLSEPRFAAAALAFATELANRFEAERVSFGLIRRGGARLASLSHTAQFGRKMNLARALERAMDEAADQRATVRAPEAQGSATLVRAATAEVAGRDGSAAAVPLFLNGRAVAALVVERRGDSPLSDAELAEIESLGALAAAALLDKWRQDRAWPVKFALWLRGGAARLLGRGHVEWKLSALAAAALVAFFATAEGTYRLPAEATLVPRAQQFVGAPAAGFLRTAPARAGDRVEAGQVLATLDDRDLQLERLRLQGEIARVEAQAQRASAERDRARAAILTAEREQHAAQLALVLQQIERSRLVAPFAGLVVSGDHSQRLGAAVEKGETLFAVSPTDSYRVDLRVRESRIGDVQPGQGGTLFLSARPDRGLPFTVARITPRVVAEEGRSFFVVEAQLDEAAAPDPSLLQPGLQGVGKVEVGPAGLWSIWTRDAREWLRLRLWWWWS